MRLPPLDIFEPNTKKDALSILDRLAKKTKIIGGGTELTILLKLGLLTPAHLMSLKAIRSLDGIRTTKKEVIIGCSTTLREIGSSSLINLRFKSVAQAARLVAAPPVQNMATIGGNILQDTRCIYRNQSDLFRSGIKRCYKTGGNMCHAAKGARRCFSVYQGDMAPSLISFNSKAKLERKGSHRLVALADLFSGRGEAPFLMQENEMLTEIIIPLPGGRYGSSYEKLRIRKGLDYPLVSVAACFSEKEGGRSDKIRIVIGAAGSGPKIVSEELSFAQSERIPVDDMSRIVEIAASTAEIVDNLSVPAMYRRKMVKVLAKRALEDSFRAMKENN